MSKQAHLITAYYLRNPCCTWMLQEPSLEKLWLKSQLNWQERWASLMFCLYKYWKPVNIDSEMCKLCGNEWSGHPTPPVIFLSYLGSAHWPTAPVVYLLVTAVMRDKGSQGVQMKHPHENLSSPTTVNNVVQGKLPPPSHGQSKPHTEKSMCCNDSGHLALLCLF